MNKGVLFQRFKYHYKRYLSIIFASIGFAFLVGSIAYRLLDHKSAVSGSLFSEVWNYVILFISFLFILIGTNRRTGLMFSGVMAFIFYLIWDFGSQIVFISISGGLSSLFSLPIRSLVFNLLFLALEVTAFVVGILLYIRMRRFLLRKYTSYRGTLALAAVFSISVVLAFALRPAILFFADPSVNLFVAILKPLAIAFEAISTFFIVADINNL